MWRKKTHTKKQSYLDLESSKTKFPQDSKVFLYDIPHPWCLNTFDLKKKMSSSNFLGNLFYFPIILIFFSQTVSPIISTQ